VTLLKYGLGLPFGVRVVRRVPIPKPVIPAPETLGQHLKQERGRRKLRQKDAATILGVGTFTYMTWEKDQKFPTVRYFPNIVAFIGYDPLPAPMTTGEKLRRERWLLGLTSRQRAAQLGIDQGTLLTREAES
jgi:DNA-binding XRE family transcriptional regulator